MRLVHRAANPARSPVRNTRSPLENPAQNDKRSIREGRDQSRPAKGGHVQGPFDDLQDDQALAPKESIGGGGGANRPRAERPKIVRPGGKALLRLLDLLETRGLVEAAEATLAVAVPDEQQRRQYAPSSADASPARSQGARKSRKRAS